MFGVMNVVPIIDLRQEPEEIAGSADAAVARLLDVTDHPTIAKWVQLPKALLLFLLVPGDPESGAFYVYDRRGRMWLWVDFDDTKFGGYTEDDFKHLVRDCHFLDIVEQPQKPAVTSRWIVQPGLRPQLANMDQIMTVRESS